MTNLDDLPQIELNIEAGNWTVQIPDLSAVLLPSLLQCLKILEKNPAQTVSVLLTSDAQMQALNKQFRQIDRPTNVLSFASDAFAGAPLGDLAFGFETCMRQAQQRDILLQEHLSHLFVHGLLHLFGFDHDNPQQAKTMEQMETKILIRAGHIDPWAQEASV
ncbi:Metal-dependent hydrolase YbeY, involved in rRNA and/or ribosome maturation and assembly [hydrothermal vent metagenome]|uniref:Metal-dependent hydrolase YbeY, involved in rRNA and/or ribosome maturation and assembly n=1 Tax=hydrothermal vent metagenome TaxID=652676 RepID=A0A3B0S7T8_9ZZZZ